MRPRDELEKDYPKVAEMLKTVYDPELGIDIWSLGLIYDIRKDKEKVEVEMTFTSPMCPYGPELVAQVQEGLNSIGMPANQVKVVFEPMWQPSQEIRDMIGI